MRVLHVNWTAGALWVWAERADAYLHMQERGQAEPGDVDAAGAARDHPFAMPHRELRAVLAAHGVTPSDDVERCLTLALPTIGEAPAPSPKLAHAAGRVSIGAEAAVTLTLNHWLTPAVAISARGAPAVLERLVEIGLDEADVDPHAVKSDRLSVASSVEYFAVAARLARSIVAQQRVVPMVTHDERGEVRAAWRPWIGDEQTAARVSELLVSTPPAVRAVVDEFEHQAWLTLEDCLNHLVDAMCRRALEAEQLEEAIADRDASSDLHVAWLHGLLGRSDCAHTSSASRSALLRGVRSWIGRLDDRGQDVDWRLCLRVEEPIRLESDTGPGVSSGDETWRIALALQSVESERVMLDADEIWASPSDAATVDGRRINDPHHVLLSELARAARIYTALERLLDEQQPAELTLSTREVYTFLRESRPLLMEQGFGVVAPTWWESHASRIGARLLVDSEPYEGGGPGGGEHDHHDGVRLGLESLVETSWRLAVGDSTLTLSEFERLASGGAPLVRVGGRWVEIRPDDVAAAVEFLHANPGGKMRVVDAMRLAYGSDPAETGVPVLGMEATGWVASLLGGEQDEQFESLDEQPRGFVGLLRPYQTRGVAWLAFLERFGLGACLADDMGLGKTIQLLALLLHEREELTKNPVQNDKRRTGRDGRDARPTRAGSHSESGSKDAADTQTVGPTLLVAPMSVVGNWKREAGRFAPSLQVIVHHGLERPSGDAFLESVEGVDLVITTYALAHRDVEDLSRVPWLRIALDEAQNIKNPSSKQTQSLRSLKAPRRIALTGTPVENRLSELWSIMDFCNPGSLGTAGSFRRRFSLPIERRRDARRASQLRSLVQPFILRRLKSDPAIAVDLPEKVQTKEHCTLSSEQAALYEAAVKRMLSAVDDAQGMRRRGMVLATLIKLKQICNHPAQFLKDAGMGEDGTPDPARSGKCLRLLDMLDEVVSAGDQALVFTQFRQMGALLAPMLAHHLDRDVLFLHGGTPSKGREKMVDRFQEADGSAPIFILSLRAGGLGMNLTAASHVFHFDRWWNPAVENQATDRAHRIGQTRTVHVHKFIVAGTLEDRIDEMIERKTELADRIISSGERWLTDLSTSQLREMLTLRPDEAGVE